MRENGGVSVGGEGCIFFFVRPFVLEVLVSVIHFYACSKPPGEKAAINVSDCRQEVSLLRSHVQHVRCCPSFSFFSPLILAILEATLSGMNQHPVKVTFFFSKQKIVKGLIVPKGSLLLSLASGVNFQQL